MRVFVSYSHADGNWVCDRLVPCLTAGGAEVLIDRERFAIGKAVVGQMDAEQDQADRQLLVLTPDYLASKYCRHEMQRACKKDPKFTAGLVLPVLRADCSLPRQFTGWSPPLRVDLRDDAAAHPWDALLRECGATGLGTTAPDWLAARDEIRKYLERNQSVNLLVNGDKANWRGLLDHLAEDCVQDLAQVDLQHPKTTHREGLLKAIGAAIGAKASLPAKPYDLAAFNKWFDGHSRVRLCLRHFDFVRHRHADYGLDLYTTLRHLNMITRQLVLLVQSKTPFGALLPPDNPLSEMDIKTVELRGRSWP
ncbi:MAG: toll/interleukin-1 receptor domain-containing protein [Gammaproteobacteria bacterium]